MMKKALTTIPLMLIFIFIMFSWPTNAQEKDPTIQVDENCTLIDAIIAANTDTSSGNCIAGNGSDTIELTVSVELTETYETNEDYGETGLPSITSTIMLLGNGHSIRRDADAPNFRILAISSDGDLTLDNVTISGGASIRSETNRTGVGGGIYNDGTLTIRNSIISENTSTFASGAIGNNGILTIENSQLIQNSSENGGAISNVGELTVTNSVISENVAGFEGGGLVTGEPTTISNSTIANNSAAWGGGMSVLHAETIVEDTTFIGNQADSDGGAMWIGPDATVTLNRSTIRSNTSGRTAGGISVQGTTTIIATTISKNRAEIGGGAHIQGTVDIIASVFFENTADSGGAIYAFRVDEAQQLNIVNSVIAHNTSLEEGAAISNISEVTIVNSTIVNNTSGEEGSGIFNHVSSDRLRVYNSIIAANTPYNCRHRDPDDEVLSGNNNLADDTSCPNTNQLVGLDDTLADHGGPTLSIALLESSNAIDAGDPEWCPKNDQRGALRIDDCDIGAFEFGATIDD